MLLKKVIPEIIKAPLRSYLDSVRSCRSQAGQDLWVLGEVFDGQREGFFVDVGAHDGVEFSNTYVLEKRYGWRGICIEANPDSFQLLNKNRRVTCVNGCLDAEEGSVEFVKNGMFGGIIAANTDNKAQETRSECVSMKTVALEHVLKALDAPSEIEYLSVDIEGAEERVLVNFPFSEWKFKCITIERPTARLRSILTTNDYLLIKEIPGLDCFYLHRAFVDQYQKNALSFYKRKHLAIRVG